jgi:hypothetical protein
MLETKIMNVFIVMVRHYKPFCILSYVDEEGRHLGIVYSRNNSPKSQSSDTGNLRKPRMMPYVGRGCDVLCI